MGLLDRFPGSIFTVGTHWRENSITNWSGCCCSVCRNSMTRRAQYGSWVVVTWLGGRWQWCLPGVAGREESQQKSHNSSSELWQRYTYDLHCNIYIQLQVGGKALHSNLPLALIDYRKRFKIRDQTFNKNSIRILFIFIMYWCILTFHFNEFNLMIKWFGNNRLAVGIEMFLILLFLYFEIDS